ncbi:LCP family protein [Clostridiaceae bacterium 35-E11]
MKKFLKVLMVSFICFVIVMSTGTYIFINSVSRGQSYNDEESEKQKNLPKKEERVNVLVVGVDAKDAQNTNGARTDTMMLATFDPDTKDVDIISIPRDSRVVIRGHKGKDKINHAHAYGGIELSMKAVKDFLGVPVHYYVKIDYEGLGKVVDDIGGVEIDVPMDMQYYDPYADPPLRINLKKGKQVLDSNKAMQFVRFRKGYQDQDLGRINAQHTFLMALANKLLQPQTIINLPKLVKTFNTYVDTDMPVSTMLNYALQARKIKLENIHMITVPGEPKLINGIWYYIPNENEIKNMINNIFNETPSQEENMVYKETKESLENTITVEVLNGSGIGGLATQTSKTLEKEGYNVINIGNIKGINYGETHIYDRKNKGNEVKKVAKILKVNKVEVDTNMESDADITIIVGRDMKK